MESHGYKVNIKIDIEGKTVEAKTFEEAQKYAPEINYRGMSSIGAVPVNKKDKSA